MPSFLENFYINPFYMKVNKYTCQVNKHIWHVLILFLFIHFNLIEHVLIKHLQGHEIHLLMPQSFWSLVQKDKFNHIIAKWLCYLNIWHAVHIKDKHIKYRINVYYYNNCKYYGMRSIILREIISLTLCIVTITMCICCSLNSPKFSSFSM